MVKRHCYYLFFYKILKITIKLYFKIIFENLLTELTFDIGTNIHKAKNNKRIIWFVLIKIKKGSWEWLNVEKRKKVKRKKLKEEEEDKIDLFKILRPPY